MPIVLLRVDERLIHGQVVLGWGSHLRPDRYVVVDDDLASSDWEQELYRIGAGSSEVLFCSVEEARGRLPEWREAPPRSILLARDVATVRRLADGGLLSGVTINLGGLHHGPGRRELLSYLHLSDEEVQILASLEDEGVEVWAQDLPDAPKVSSRSLRGG
ncbi:MAG: PTS sugar transporter subunit IIB [Longimicrobiales bacterium]|nr:PTS sugar transporter subunit IIB [Longimicrobiales bacterium]